MTDIHSYQPVSVEEMWAGVDDKDPQSAGVKFQLSMEPPDEWSCVNQAV